MARSAKFLSWRTVLIFVLVAIIGVNGRPFGLSNSRPVFPGPSILKSKSSIADVSAVIKMTKNWVDPDAKDLNETRLLQQLGQNFDSFFMSVKPPTGSRKAVSMALSMRSASIKEEDVSMPKMPWRIRQLQFEIKRRGNGRGRVLGHRASTKLRQWLWELSHCPINYSWVDYSAKVFPRYIRYGKCVEKPCSFPAGLTCRPRSTRTLRLLIWICPQNSSCSWHPFSFKVYESCECGCKKARWICTILLSFAIPTSRYVPKYGKDYPATKYYRSINCLSWMKKERSRRSCTLVWK